jgi:adenylylsulfate kinase-like enzyme
MRMGVVMLSGPVAAGKTTVARELVVLSKGQQCYLEGDTFWSFFTKMDGAARRERFRLIMRSMTAAAIPLARGGYEVLLDFSFPLEFLEAARKILKEVPMDFVVLRPSLAECEKRARERKEGAIRDYSMYRDFYAMFEGMPRHEICDDEADAKALAARIRAGLDGGGFRIS